ncbi:MAG TPA: cytochrome P450 [Mycobacteriales bacterium]
MTIDERFTAEANEERLRAGEGLGVRNEPTLAPVEDFATDFDHLDPAWAADPYPIWDDLRTRCPIAHTDRFGGGWLPTSFADVQAIAHDTEHFTSRSIVMSNFRPDPSEAPAGGAPPITSDPPFHHAARKLLLPAFTKTAVGRLEEQSRDYCHQLCDALEGRDVVDAATEYAQYIPVRVISDMLGFPREDIEQFLVFVKNVLEGINDPLEARMENFEVLFRYLAAQIDDHLARPREDLTTYLIDAEMNGEKLGADHVTGTMALLLIAGIDTTWSAIGASIWHLSKTPDDRRRIAADRALLAPAMEEFLRAFAPVTMARLVRDDFTFSGVDMKADDWVLLAFPSANRDPAQFERAGEVVIDREVNRHAAFGLGIHRCVGSHLARMELRVAMETWFDRFPEFSLADPDAVTWSHGQVRGPRTLPIRLG